MLRMTLRIMIFWSRSYMCPDAIVNTCTTRASSSSSGPPAKPRSATRVS